VRGEVTKILESARRDKVIGNSLEAAVNLFAGKDLYIFLGNLLGDLPNIFIVSGVTLANIEDAPTGAKANDTMPELVVSVSPAGGKKCERCWMYHEGVGADAEHQTLCPRCAAVIKGA